ncbi:hypothetical protein [Bradyrhizobium sp. C9]|uniref:hypothetical protein n=1 Tax=Bradyrhizobium sp. C9 TaxID=142585 RepID=UPI000BE8B676|nr:hypothetical protein [Bradyrhizobium sp. C9]PDT74127.1 hypothetical protein CO675_27025 [Bradyrhizobium sp. C9]
MSDEKTAEALADDTTTDATPVNDGIIDLDAQPEVKDEAAEEEEGEAKPEGKEEPEGEDKPKKPSGAQRAKFREQRLLNELQAREREIEELRRSTPAAKTAGEGEDKPPREEDYNGDWFAWQRALTAYDAGKAAREAIKGEFKTREQSEHEKRQVEVARERSVAHAERVEDAREVIADFDQAMEGMKGVNVRNDVLDEIMSSDKSALIAYHLAKNPDELNALNSMSGRELARAMGRLEATVRMPEAKKATSAPPPLSKPKGGASPSSPEADLQAWLKRKYG